MDLLQMTEQDVLGRFDFSAERGFLPKTDPLISFSLEQEGAGNLSEWMAVARDLPDYIAQGVVREKILSLPQLSLKSVAKEEYEYAMLLCSYFGHAYVFSATDTKSFIPRNIAIPWCFIAEKLERPPVLSYASYCMNNWRRIDPNEPIEFGNLTLVQKFSGGFDESGFVLVHTAIEAKAGLLGSFLWNALRAAYKRDVGAVHLCLSQASTRFASMLSTLHSMLTWCDPYIYYARVRPYLFGWEDNPTFPDGVVYAGCFNGKAQKFRGETGAQSSIIPMVDAFLGVQHAQDRLWQYLQEMKRYMPWKHRQFLEVLTPHAYVMRDLMKDLSRDLRDPYNQCLFNLYLFREIHRGFTKRYIEEQQEKAGNPTAVGTGGTPLSEYLKAHSENTLKAIL